MINMGCSNLKIGVTFERTRRLLWWIAYGNLLWPAIIDFKELWIKWWYFLSILYSRDVLILYYNITMKDFKFKFRLFIIVKFQKKKKTLTKCFELLNEI